jgi:hypothetical protein
MKNGENFTLDYVQYHTVHDYTHSFGTDIVLRRRRKEVGQFMHSQKRITLRNSVYVHETFTWKMFQLS